MSESAPQPVHCLRQSGESSALYACSRSCHRCARRTPISTISHGRNSSFPRSREHGGSGLGLSIVHDAAALYGGTVTVDGVEPHGARFTVTFPRAKADNAPEVQKEVPET